METSKSIGRPRNVELAVRLLYASAALVVVLTIFARIGWLNLPVNNAVIINFATFALLAFTANRIGNRRNWARWLFAVIYAVGTLLGAVLMLTSPEVWQSVPATGIVTSLIQTALQTAAMFLVFTASANRWFRAQATEREPAV